MNMKLRDEFNKTQGKKWLVPWDDKKEIEYQAAYIRFLETKLKQLDKPVVSGKQPTTQEIEALAQVALEDAIPGNIAMWADDSEEREYYKIVWKRGFTAALSTVAGLENKDSEDLST